LNMLDITFDDAPWMLELKKLPVGATFSAARFLTLTEGEDPIEFDEALQFIENHRILLDVSDLPPITLSGSDALRLKQEAQLAYTGDVTCGLDENDPLKLYLQELAFTPAAGDVQLLAEEYAAGKQHLAEQIVTLSLSRVVETAFSYTGHGVLLLDLIQEGSMGLWQSLLSYEKGDFSEYSQGFISRYMARIVIQQARDSGAGQKLRQDMEDYLDVDQRLLAELGRNAVAEEIAEAMHISVEEVNVIEKMVITARNVERAHEAQKEPEPSPEDDQAVEDTAYFRLRQQIAELLSGLSETDAKLLTMRFGLEGGAPMTPTQVGNSLGLTPEQVVQREAAALAKLRNQ